MTQQPLFQLGEILMTDTIGKAIADSKDFEQFVATSFYLFTQANFGECNDGEDKILNDNHLRDGYGSLLGIYNLGSNRIFIYTESDHSATTICFAEEF